MSRRIFVPLLLLVGCAPEPGALHAPPAGPVTTRIETSGMSIDINAVPDRAIPTFSIAAPVEEVWRALPTAFAMLDLPAGVISEPDRVFGNPSIRARREFAGERAAEFLDCGKNPIGAPIVSTAALDVAVRAMLQPVDPSRTNVQVQLGGVATASSRGTRHNCASTGQLEKALMEQIHLQLAQARQG